MCRIMSQCIFILFPILFAPRYLGSPGMEYVESMNMFQNVDLISLIHSHKYLFHKTLSFAVGTRSGKNRKVETQSLP